MSSCSQSFSTEALLRSVHEMAERITELHDLRRRVREAEARALAMAQSSAHLEEGRDLITGKFVKTFSAATIGARRLDCPVTLKFDGLERPATGSSHRHRAGIRTIAPVMRQ